MNAKRNESAYYANTLEYNKHRVRRDTFVFEDEARKRRELKEPEAKRTVNTGEAVKPKNGLFSTLLVLTMIFGVFALMVFGYQGVFAQEKYLNNLKNEIEEIKLDNERLLSQIAFSEDIGRIQEVASDKLSMGFPDTNQVVPVKLMEMPKEFTDISLEQNEIGGANVDIFAKIKSLFE